ncbi:hypothetical protein PR202_gb08516 [Eleusine coracana subsp. coracana]|uniref:Uncharacterized protein n=1 Tax=Eleusine coracana subsp. coracana TaxID=191504 RepID=A0AAV5EFC3_ELECO|nr:hypothetical protein PR202_gb08516 [Eleusine coracana subsp. coracana]
MSPVRVVDVSYVPVPAQAALPPEPIKLNAMEVQWVVLPLFQHILFFEGDQLPPFEAVVHSLKSSLAETLATHGPLAGKLVHLADTGEIAIRCSHDDGVKFVVAESGADARRLAGDEEHNVHAFERLVPELDLSVLPAPLLAVQATRLQGGGVAVGVTVHHGVADGRSLWRFVEAWAAACRGGVPPAAPSFDRSRVKLRLPVGDKELARSVLLKYSSALIINALIAMLKLLFPPPRANIMMGEISATSSMQRAKGGEREDLWLLGSSPSSSPTDDDDDVFLFFFADLRSHLDPPAGADYFGACISGCLPRLPARDLRSDHALAAAAVAIQEAIRDMEADPVGGWDFLTLCTGLSEVNSPYFNVSGSTSFRPYEVADFGWGRPRRTEPVRMNRDGQVALVRARDGDGVQVSVAMLQRAHMEAFKAEFFNAIVNV